MAGHSHWARIKRAKAVTDARRGKAWSKLARGVIMAARQGGGDPDSNLALRYAIDAAKAGNMPKDTIDRAIKKGTGELGAEAIEEMTYEGYGPGGAAILCRIMTDNRNRTAPEVKKIFELHGGNLGAANSVAWMFTRRGQFIISSSAADEETLTNLALEVGADDLQQDGDAFLLTCDPSQFEPVRKALAASGVTPESAEIAMVPKSTVHLEGDQARRVLDLMEALEDHDDVQNVYSNFDVSAAELEKLSR